MSAADHLLQRAARWLAVRMLRARIKQIDRLMPQVEADIVAGHDALAALRFEAGRLRRRLSFVNRGRPRSAPAGTYSQPE